MTAARRSRSTRPFTWRGRMTWRGWSRRRHEHRRVHERGRAMSSNTASRATPYALSLPSLALFGAMGIGIVKMLYTPTAVVVALVHVMLPFMVIPVWTSLQKLDPMVESAALSLNASQWTVMRRIVLPQITPGLLSGSLIVFGLSA